MKKKPSHQVKHKSDQNKPVEKNLFEKIEIIAQSRQKLLLAISIGISVLFSLLLFNPDVSYGGDDSSYIQNSYNFLKGIAFPSYQGPLYPIVLALFIAVFGINLIVLKLVSVAFSAASIYFLYKLFVKLTNYTTATLVAFITATSFIINIFAGTTYSEPLFTLLQALFLFLLIKYIDTWKSGPNPLKAIWKPVLVLALLSFALFQTRSIAIVVLPFTLLVLLFEKQYTGSLFYVLSTGAIYGITGLYKKMVWGASSAGFTNQLNSLLLKNFYKPAEGNENLAGLIKRFWINSELYLSKHLAKMTGFKSYDSITRNTTLTIAIYAIFILGAILIWKKQKNFRYLLLYLAAMIGTSFIMLQNIWDQERIIMIYFPLIIGFLLYALYVLFQHHKTIRFQWLYIAFALVMLGAISFQSIKRVDTDSFSSKFKSGTFSSYTPDWQNYMLASRWAAANLPDSAVVVCRKPQMSWIAAKGKDIFKGIYRVESNDPDSTVALFQEMGATHVIMGNLRINPKKKTDRTITTIKNSLILINARYPAGLKLLHEVGTDEKAYVFELNFNKNLKNDQYLKNLDAALTVNPKNKQISSLIANWYFSKQLYDLALKYLDFSLVYFPDDPELNYSKGLCLYQQSNYQEAVLSFEKALQVKSDYYEACYNASVCHFYLGNYEKSRRMLKQAREIGFTGDTRALEAGLAQTNPEK